MRVGAFGVPPYAIFDGRSVRGVDSDIVAMIARKFGFTFELSWGRFFGDKDPKTGEWTGLLGQVECFMAIRL